MEQRPRITIILDKHLHTQLCTMAKRDHRNISRQVAMLIDQEWQRRQRTHLFVTPAEYDPGAGTA